MQDHLAHFDKNMFSFGGINFSRGHELEVSQRKEVEELMHTLAKHHIHLPSKTLNDAIMLPKDTGGNAEKYPSERAALFHNPYGTAAYKAEEARRYKELLKEMK